MIDKASFLNFGRGKGVGRSDGGYRAGNSQHSEIFFRLQRHQYLVRTGRMPCVVRRKRRRKIDSDEDPFRRVYARRGRNYFGGQAVSGAFGIGCAGKGHQHYLSGALLNSLLQRKICFSERLPKKLGNVDWKRVYETAKKNFEQVNLHIDPKTIARKSTVAQQQLVEISRALSVNAKIVIMDEPTSSLSEREVEKLFGIIREFKARNITVIYISHKLEDLRDLRSRDGSQRWGDDGHAGSFADFQERNCQFDGWTRIGTVLSQSCLYAQRRGGLQGQHVCAGDRVKDVSFQLYRGEILGFAGLVGAGRTETMRARSLARTKWIQAKSS